MRTYFLFAAVSFVAVFSSNARAEFADTRVVRLSTLDQAKIGQVACASHNALSRVEALQYKSGSQKGRITAWVVCAENGSQDGYPSHKLTDCSNSTGAWNCAEGHLALGIKVANGIVYLHPSMEVETESAVEVIRWAWTQDAFQGQVFSRFMKSPCNVSPDLENGSVLECGGWELHIAKDCTENGCKYHSLRLEGPKD